MWDLFLEVIEIISDRPLIRARNLILVQRALGFGLSGRGRLLIGNGALAFNAQAFQRDAGARHLLS